MVTRGKKAGAKFRRWLRSVTDVFTPEPHDNDELIDLLRGANARGVMDNDSFDTMQRVLQVSDLRVRDVMIPRFQMVVLEKDHAPAEHLPTVIESAHSRFPVIDEDRDDVVGILLAKDLLRYYDTDSNRSFNLRDVLRPAVFVPDSKRLNVLLAEFRASRNHMAIVVDEYGGTAGLVTIEDVLEQIVGNIEDEHDVDEDAVMITERGTNDFVVKALCPLDDFNERFGTKFDDEEFDTIAGLLMSVFGRMPKRGESVGKDGLVFEILHADARRLYLVRVTRVVDEDREPEQAPELTRSV